MTTGRVVISIVVLLGICRSLVYAQDVSALDPAWQSTLAFNSSYEPSGTDALNREAVPTLAPSLGLGGAVAATPLGLSRLAAVASPPSPVEPGVVSVPATVKMLFVAAPAGATDTRAQAQHTDVHSAARARRKRVRSVVRRT